MNLLTDDCIPVRPLGGGACQQITLQTLLCNGQRCLVALPRDDMEMATFQLLICLLQTLWMPSDA
ncbi:type I-E CRISPR-associated protein Cse1/CasA, partial [Erwinia amylovora]|uniref:type I-E CRISPR-associated protein Cse1/CasA n=1 Tax=Erwinia amylovora TaxID=552 RepID=UPI0020C0DBD4